MLALGVLLTCAALLGIVLSALVFRRPDPPRWTTRSWAGEFVAIGLVCVLSLGLGYLGAGSIDAYQQGLAASDLGLLAAVLVLTLVVWRKLNLRERWRAMAAEERGPATVPRAVDQDMTAAPAVGQAPDTTERTPSGPADRAA